MKALALCCALALAAPVRAAAPEALKAGAAAGFQGALSWAPPAKRWVRLSGIARFNGAAYAPSAAAAYVPLSGTVELSGSGYTTGPVAVSHADTFPISGSFASGWTRPYFYVSVYRDGRYVGGAWASGMVYLAGSYAYGWATLSGSGTLEADLQVDE